jgi:hypothetical protein
VSVEGGDILATYRAKHSSSKPKNWLHGRMTKFLPYGNSAERHVSPVRPQMNGLQTVEPPVHSWQTGACKAPPEMLLTHRGGGRERAHGMLVDRYLDEVQQSLLENWR